MSKWVLEGFQEWDQLSDNTALVPRLRQEMHSGGCMNWQMHHSMGLLMFRIALVSKYMIYGGLCGGSQFPGFE